MQKWFCVWRLEQQAQHHRSELVPREFQYSTIAKRNPSTPTRLMAFASALEGLPLFLRLRFHFLFLWYEEDLRSNRVTQEKVSAPLRKINLLFYTTTLSASQDIGRHQTVPPGGFSSLADISF
jgi:hypothetical protein